MKPNMIMPSAQRKYIFKKAEPAYGMLKSVAVGFDCFKPGFKIKGPEPFLDTMAIELTISGNSFLHHKNQKVENKKDALTLLLPNLKFCEIVEKEPWQTCWFVLWGPLANKFKSMVNKSSCAVSLANVPSQIQFNMFEACRLILQQPVNWQWSWFQHLFCVLNYTQESLLYKVEQNLSLIERACSLMEKNLFSPLPIPIIAELLNVSLSAFSHQFKNETGFSPANFYRHQRIKKAKHFLENGISVTETSQQMGFENPYHFSRLYKKIEGTPPSQFQKQSTPFQLKTYTRHHKATPPVSGKITIPKKSVT